MIKVIICGINGKMGKTIASTLYSDEMISIIGATGRPGSDVINKNYWRCSSIRAKNLT